MVEFLDWQALDKGRSPTTVCAYQQDLSMFLTYCVAVGVAALEHVLEWVLHHETVDPGGVW